MSIFGRRRYIFQKSLFSDMWAVFDWTNLHAAKFRLQFDWHSESAWQPMTQSTKASPHLVSQRSLWPHNEFIFSQLYIELFSPVFDRKSKNCTLFEKNSVLVNLVDTGHWMLLEPVLVLKLILSISFPPKFLQTRLVQYFVFFFYLAIN